jgi:hypothetical protein
MCKEGRAMISDLKIALDQLKGLPLTRILSAVTMPMLTFGELRTEPSPRGGTREMGTFELHLQCAWRFIYLSSIYMGSGDYLEKDQEEDGDESKEIASVIKEKTNQLFSACQANLTVEDISMDEFGGFRIFFRCGAILEVFPDASYEAENWRLFKPGEKPHVVSRAVDRPPQSEAGSEKQKL